MLRDMYLLFNDRVVRMIPVEWRLNFKLKPSRKVPLIALLASSSSFSVSTDPYVINSVS